jgi:hypothetical protein
MALGLLRNSLEEIFANPLHLIKGFGDFRLCYLHDVPSEEAGFGVTVGHCLLD